MILDALFSKAAADFKPGLAVSIQATVTKNQTGGFNSTTNNASTEGPVKLGYTPQQSFVPASFSSANPPIIKISSKTVVVPGQSLYEVDILGKSFAPVVDANTQIVSGAAGAVFVTISLCNYVVQEIPK